MQFATDGPRLDILNILCEEIDSRIAAAGGDVGAAAYAASSESEAMEQHIQVAKAEARATKVEIAGWKAWWDALPPDRASLEIPKRQTEITRLASKLARLEAEIGALSGRHALVSGVAGALRVRADIRRTHGAAADRMVRDVLREAFEPEARREVKSRSRVKATNPKIGSGGEPDRTSDAARAGKSRRSTKAAPKPKH